MRNISLTLFLFLFALSCCQAQPSADQIWEDLNQELNTSTYPNIDGIIVKVGEEILVESYYNGFTKDSLHDTRSSFKSITSILAGIAIDQGLITLDDQLAAYFPETNNTLKGSITVKDLLEMRSGLDCEEFYGMGPDCEDAMWNTKDWIKFCLNIEMKHHPGTNWSYSSIPPVILGEIISRASGTSIMDFAAANLFEPMGIVSYRWHITPKGRGMTAGSFFMRPIDMLKVIQMVKDQGMWQGKRIVSESWMNESTDCNLDIDFPFLRFSNMNYAIYESARYGYYWYRERLRYGDIDTEALFSSGNGGQYMMYLADYDAMVVFTGSNYGNWRGKLPFEILLKYLIPIIN